MVAEPPFVNHVLQSLIKSQELWCFFLLRGSLLGSSMNSQAFKSSNDLRRIIFSESKDVQIFQSTKWLELKRIWGPVGFQRYVGICIILEDGTKLFRLFWKFHNEASVWLRWPALGGEQDGKATSLFSTKMQRVLLPLNQYAPEGDVNFLHQNMVPDEQGSPGIYLGRRVYLVAYFIRSVFQHLLMQTGDVSGNNCEDTRIWPNVCTLYATLGCEFYMVSKSYKHMYIGTLSCFLLCCSDFGLH